MATRAKPKSNIIIEKSAGAVVFYRAEPAEYLLLRSTYWEFPKGMIDPKESEEEAAKREVWEETGLQISLLPPFRELIQYFYRHKSDSALVKKQVVYFLGQAHARDFKISWEHQEARWVTLEQAMELLTYENARAILNRANAQIIAS